MSVTFGNPITYTIENTAGLVLEVGELNRGNGGAIRLWNPEGGEAQQWRFEPAGDGFYRLRNVFSGKLMDTALQGTENGTGVHQWEDTGADSQLWSAVPAKGPGGGFKIHNKASGTCLGFMGAPSDEGACAEIWESRKGQFQRWKITQVQPVVSHRVRRKKTKGAGTN